MSKIYTAIGLMSGSSLDGVDVSLIRSDGFSTIERLGSKYLQYNDKFSQKLREFITQEQFGLLEIKEMENAIGFAHIIAIKEFLSEFDIDRNNIDIVGYHGQNILHSPKNGISWQLHAAQMVADRVGIDVVSDFRTKNVIQGGEGAPMLPMYCHSIFKKYNQPIVVLNIGGISNITYLDGNNLDNIIGFDIGVGNSVMNDLCKLHLGVDYDRDGEIALSGKVDHDFVESIMSNSFFQNTPPKSLDRDYFVDLILKKNHAIAKIEDILASICHIIAKSLLVAMKFLPKKPERIVIYGGGRKNRKILNEIRSMVDCKVLTLDESESIDGDFFESEAFAFFAIRHLLGVPNFLKQSINLQNQLDFMNYEKEKSNPRNFFENGEVMHVPNFTKEISLSGGVLFKK